MKLVFIDCEYTSTHARTTLISVGLVTIEGNELYVILNDFDREQISDWVRENVLINIDETEGVSSKEACERISQFLENYSNGEKITFISAGKVLDILLIFQLWHSKYPYLKFFSFERYLPIYLRHRSHFDLDTIFFLSGYNPDELNREVFAKEEAFNQNKHNAIYDAKVVRKCFLRLKKEGKLKKIKL